VGDDVGIYDRITLAALTVGNKPKLTIGDSSDISTRIAVLVGNEVCIGSDCMIGCSLITDNPGHNFEYEARHQRLKQERIGRVLIGNRVWAAAESMIIGKVTIGEGAIIGARAVVTKDVPPFCVVTGNPASIVRKLPFPEEMITRLGREEYQKYLDAKVD
jgi:acetyltransferase-like isoleucine patch superfamily enzyme